MHSGTWETEALLCAQKSNDSFHGMHINILIAPLRQSTSIMPSLSYKELFVNLWKKKKLIFFFFFLVEMEKPFLQM